MLNKHAQENGVRKFCESRGVAIYELIWPFCEHDCMICCIYPLIMQLVPKDDAKFNLRNAWVKRTNRWIRLQSLTRACLYVAQTAANHQRIDW